MMEIRPKIRVLFLSTTNAARSQMAEAFLRQRGGDRFDSYSAGLDPTDLSPYTRQVMAEVGLNLNGQRAKIVSDYLGKMHFGYVITVCDYAEQHCPTAFLGLSQRLHWPLDDPAKFVGSEGETLARYRQVRDQIDQRVHDWLAEQTPAWDATPLLLSQPEDIVESK